MIIADGYFTEFERFLSVIFESGCFNFSFTFSAPFLLRSARSPALKALSELGKFWQASD